MATAFDELGLASDPKSPNFDPYERDLKEYYDAGKKAGASELEAKKVANKSRHLDLVEDQQAAQRRREASADAQREAKAAQRSNVSRETSSPPALSAPTLSVPGVSSLGVGTGGPDRATSARIIVVIVIFAAIGTVAHDAIVGPLPATPVKVGNGTVQVPTHLRTLGAVLIMGTIALVVNEADPGIGLLLGVALGLDVIVNTFTGPDKGTGILSRLRHGLLADTKPATSSSGGSQTTNPTTTFPSGIAGLPAVGPAGVSQPQYHWNGKTWVPVVSTTQP